MREGVGTEFRLLGPVEVVGDDAVLALGGPKQRALLAELLLRRGAAVSRERLVDVLWGERPPPSAIASLQVYVHGLRRAIGAQRLETRGAAYRLRVEPEELDVARFERLLADARTALAGGTPAHADELLAAALALWRGEALADLGDSPVRAAAAGLDDLRLQALELRIDARLALGEHREVVLQLEELVAAEPYRERLREQLVLALYRSGRQDDALAAYQDARRTLADDLGVEPGPGLRELERAVLQHDPSLTLERREETSRPRLPAPATPLVGRRLELAAVEAILGRDGVRLVTLTGPGGTGKTRLALAVAERLAHLSRDGAAFVDLSDVQDAALIVPTIGQALGEDAQAVEARLADSSLLLVLDNLEQVASGAAPAVAALLANAPRLRVLATSRVPLRVSGEQEYAVPPLPSHEAEALFTARATAVDAEFALTEETAPLVARICARLDGLPLALELAAARVRVLPLRALELRLENALDVLVGGARDLPTRQQALRATLDWSFALLDPAAQALLARLAVFAGEVELDDLEAVLGTDVDESLAALVEASLVRRRGERFTLLQTIREYALERLAERDEVDELHRRHAARYLEVAEHAWELILPGGAAEAEGMAVLEREADNLRASFAWATAHGEGETAVRLAVAQRWFWLVRGRFVEARAAFDAAAEAQVEPTLHAAALNGAATFAAHQGETARARDQWNEALQIYRAHGDEDEVARCVAELGGVAVAEGDLEQARELYEEAVVRFGRLGHRVRESVSLSNLAAIADQRDDLAASVDYSEQAIALQREIDDPLNLAVSLTNLAPTVLRLGEVDRARALLREGVELAEEVGHTLLLAHTLAVAAELAACDGDGALAARLIGATEAAFAAIGGEVPEGERRAFVRIRARLDLPEDEVELERGVGRTWPLERAVAETRGLFS
ncbi:MAG TPA: BTAD domain-containing putative transcriptional regulator [Gaiellaceae bacterium]|nr:BTAD domain-containing putative transcriptional regulator [Gaiellaceae bacterium]